MPLNYRVDITAGRGFGSRLAGLGSLIGQGRERKRQEEEQAEADRLLQEARKKAQAAIASNNPVKIAEVMSEFPELLEEIESSMGIGGEMRERQLADQRRTFEQILADPPRAPRILNERIVMLENAGRDPSQSIELFEEFQGDDPEQALKSVEMMYAAAIGPEEFKKYQEAIAEPELEDMGIVQIFGADGRDYTALTDGKGNYFDNQGKSITVSVDDRIVRGSLTGGVEAIGMGDMEARELRSSAVGTINFANTAKDAIALLDETEDINTFVAGAAGIINDLQQEFKAIGRQIGVDFDESRLDPEGHEETFDDLGIKNARMKSLITTLAYARALSNNPDGRISTPDLREAIKEIGATASDPRAFKQVLEDVSRRAARSFRTNYRARTGNEYAGEYGEIGGAPASVSTDAEYESLAPGTEYIMGGKTYRKPG